MRRTHRLLLVCGLAAMLAACGGTESDPTATDAAAAKGGKSGGGTTTSASGVSISATNGVVGGYTKVSFYPGSYASDSLYIGYTCTQNGATVLAASSWELHYAVSAGYSAYSLVGDHYEVYFSPLSSQTYTSGSASCVVQGYVGTSKGLKSIASGAFSISG